MAQITTTWGLFIASLIVHINVVTCKNQRVFINHNSRYHKINFGSLDNYVGINIDYQNYLDYIGTNKLKQPGVGASHLRLRRSDAEQDNNESGYICNSGSHFSCDCFHCSNNMTHVTGVVFSEETSSTSVHDDKCCFEILPDLIKIETVSIVFNIIGDVKHFHYDKSFEDLLKQKIENNLKHFCLNYPDLCDTILTYSIHNRSSINIVDSNYFIRNASLEMIVVKVDRNVNQEPSSLAISFSVLIDHCQEYYNQDGIDISLKSINCSSNNRFYHNITDNNNPQQTTPYSEYSIINHAFIIEALNNQSDILSFDSLTVISLYSFNEYLQYTTQGDMENGDDDDDDAIKLSLKTIVLLGVFGGLFLMICVISAVKAVR